MLRVVLCIPSKVSGLCSKIYCIVEPKSLNFEKEIRIGSLFARFLPRSGWWVCSRQIFVASKQVPDVHQDILAMFSPNPGI